MCGFKGLQPLVNKDCWKSCDLHGTWICKCPGFRIAKIIGRWTRCKMWQLAIDRFWFHGSFVWAIFMEFRCRDISLRPYGQQLYSSYSTSKVLWYKDLFALSDRHGCRMTTWISKIFHWLVVWNIFNFSIYWECHHPNWLSYFSEG